jgi:hypothetical protein
MNWKVHRRKRSWRDLNWAYYPGFCLEDRGTPRNSSDRTAGLRAEVQTRDIPDSKQECQPLDRKGRPRDTCPESELILKYMNYILVHLVQFLGRGIGPLEGVYLQRTAQQNTDTPEVWNHTRSTCNETS